MTARMNFSSFVPASRAAQASTEEFIVKMNSWGEARKTSEQQLRVACESVTKGVKPSSFISKDALNMSVFGVMFDRPPAVGFVPAPSSVAVAAKKAGMKGLAYVPDVQSEHGRQIFKMMIQLSSVCEKRPLLNMKGVQGFCLDGRKIMLTGAVKTNDGVRVIAHPKAVSHASELTLVTSAAAAHKPATQSNEAKSSLTGPRVWNRPTPYDLND